MGLFKIWKDHVTQYSNRYREVQNADGTITHEAVRGRSSARREHRRTHRTLTTWKRGYYPPG